MFFHIPPYFLEDEIISLFFDVVFLSQIIVIKSVAQLLRDVERALVVVVPATFVSHDAG